MSLNKITAIIVLLVVIAATISIGCSSKSKMCKGMSFHKRDIRRGLSSY
ncbi:MAG: hypothetical protein WC223_09915 [Bacteroidales bacterium]